MSTNLLPILTRFFMARPETGNRHLQLTTFCPSCHLLMILSLIGNMVYGWNYGATEDTEQESCHIIIPNYYVG